MKRTIAACIAALALGSATSALAAEAHSHGHPSSQAASSALEQLKLNQGRRWATDAALRQNMGEIRDVLASRRDSISARRLSSAESRELGTVIESRVIAILKECKLESAADFNLHLIVAELVQSADVLLGKSKGLAGKAASRAVVATQMYATYFEHPGWTAVYN